MPETLDPLLPEAEVDPDGRPAIDWPTDPWDNADRTGSVERLRRQTRPVKWGVYTVIALFTVMVMVAGAVGWWYINKINPPGEPGDVASFTVADNETVESLAQRLEDDGIISDAGVFEWYVDRQDEELEITPGYYELRPDDHMGNVLAVLRTPPAQTKTRVTFPEGFTIDQMGRRLETTVDRISAADFTTAAADPSIAAGLAPPEGPPSLEGLLFPDTYEVSNAENGSQLIDRMIGLMERVGDQEDIVAKSAILGRTPYEILIIASMIEKEAGVAEDRAKISTVIHNRLAVTALDPEEPFHLGIDASVLYGRAQNGLDTALPFSELRTIPTDWNTYLLPGLPKTPIANPGRESIRAALNPAPNPPPGDPICQVLPKNDRADNCYYYFYVLADEDGRHAFAATLAAHQANYDAAVAAGVIDG